MCAGQGGLGEALICTLQAQSRRWRAAGATGGARAAFGLSGAMPDECRMNAGYAHPAGYGAIRGNRWPGMVRKAHVRAASVAIAAARSAPRACA